MDGVTFRFYFILNKDLRHKTISILLSLPPFLLHVQSYDL